jgi:hypothetical protein
LSSYTILCINNHLVFIEPSAIEVNFLKIQNYFFPSFCDNDGKERNAAAAKTFFAAFVGKQTVANKMLKWWLYLIQFLL